jgi:phosphoglycolate phosphatase-like HAD superfamily hydrolase
MQHRVPQWLRILNDDVITHLGRVRHAVFDFDGTVSVLRQGWEPVMEKLMIQAICPDGDAPETLVDEVRRYIDSSTGQLTIHQMRWLSEAVARYGPGRSALKPQEYKLRYLDALMVSVRERLDGLESGAADPEKFMIAGAKELLSGLSARGVRLYIASGSDHADVVHEAAALGIAPLIDGGIYGALDASEANAKDRIIQRILDQHHLSGDELLVAGDGPVEIIEARARGAVAMGVPSDEVARQGWNEHKVSRLKNAGADFLVPDYIYASELVDLLVKG